jgi:hypothetical protein
MPKKIVLSKSVLSKLSSEENNKLKKLEKEDSIILEKMLKAQSAYTQYVRKVKNTSSIKARKLADKGFKYEYLAFKSYNKLAKYKELLKKKYSKK